MAPRTRPPAPDRNSRASSTCRSTSMSARSASPAEVVEREASPATRRPSSVTRRPSPATRRPSPASRFRISESEPSVEPLNDAMYERLKKLHNTTSRKAYQRTQNLRHVERSTRLEGLTEAIKKDFNFCDPYVAMKVVKKISEDRSWNISNASSLLPRIKDCLLEPQYQEAAVEELRNVCDAMLETLVRCAKHQTLLGVDVAAEERKRKAEESLKVLRDVRDGRARYFKKMSTELAEDLDAVIYRLIAI